MSSPFPPAFAGLLRWFTERPRSAGMPPAGTVGGPRGGSVPAEGDGRSAGAALRRGVRDRSTRATGRDRPGRSTRVAAVPWGARGAGEGSASCTGVWGCFRCAGKLLKTSGQRSTDPTRKASLSLPLEGARCPSSPEMLPFLKELVPQETRQIHHGGRLRGSGRRVWSSHWGWGSLPHPCSPMTPHHPASVCRTLHVFVNGPCRS